MDKRHKGRSMGIFSRIHQAIKSLWEDDDEEETDDEEEESWFGGDEDY